MRIDLVTPFAEKDAAKALGARWDSAKKVWYIADVPDLAPFARWLPDKAAAATSMAAGPHRRLAGAPQPTPVRTGKAPVMTRATVDLPDCGCDVLPWEDCAHTTRAITAD